MVGKLQLDVNDTSGCCGILFWGIILFCSLFIAASYKVTYLPLLQSDKSAGGIQIEKFLNSSWCKCDEVLNDISPSYYLLFYIDWL